MKSKRFLDRYSIIFLVVVPQIFTINLAGPALLDKDKVSPFRKISKIQLNQLPYKLVIKCGNYGETNRLNLINEIEIKIPSNCVGLNTELSFISLGDLGKYYYPYGNIYIKYDTSLNGRVYLKTNLGPSYKADSSAVYSYRLNSKNRFKINIEDSNLGSLKLLASEYCSKFDKRNPLCLVKTKNHQKYESDFVGLNYILGIYTYAGKSCSNISTQTFFPSYTGVDSILPKSYEILITKHLNKSPGIRLICIEQVDELVEKGIVPSISLNHSLVKEGISKNVPVSFALVKKEKFTKENKSYSVIKNEKFEVKSIKFTPGEAETLYISNNPKNSSLVLNFKSKNQERLLFTGIPFSSSNLLNLDNWEIFIINDAFLGIKIPPNISTIEIKKRNK